MKKLGILIAGAITLQSIIGCGGSGGSRKGIGSKLKNGVVYISSVDDKVHFNDLKGKDIALTSGPEQDSWPFLSPDGKYLGFSKWVAPTEREIMIQDLTDITKAPFQVTYIGGDAQQGTFNEDGSKIVLVSDSPANFYFDLKRIDIDGNNLETLTNGSGSLQKYDFQHPVVLDDGIIVEALDWKASDLYKIPTNGDLTPLYNSQRLTNDGDVDTEAARTFDGQKVYWTKSSAAFPFGRVLFVMDKDGSNQIPLTTAGEYNWNPRPSPNNGLLAYIGNKNGPAELFVNTASDPTDISTEKSLTTYIKDTQGIDFGYVDTTN